MTDYKFEGWQGNDAESANGNMTWGEFQPKKWEDDDVDIKITHSGICGSDLHTLRSGWVSFDFRRVTRWEGELLSQMRRPIGSKCGKLT